MRQEGEGSIRSHWCNDALSDTHYALLVEDPFHASDNVARTFGNTCKCKGKRCGMPGMEKVRKEFQNTAFVLATACNGEDGHVANILAGIFGYDPTTLVSD